jgi:SAM-dependent methyltransferase
VNGTSTTDGWHFVLGEGGQSLLAELALESDSSLSGIEIVSRLRKRGLSPEHVSAALSQAKLQRRAQPKFGSQSSEMLFTEAALEQATRSEVAQTHARRFVDANISTVFDLGCGIGAESLALASAGLSVTAVELDPLTAELAAFNLRKHPSASVVVADAEQYSFTDDASVFLDPARRTAGHNNTTRLTNSDEYSPRLDFAFSLGEQQPTAIKLGPGFDRAEIPDTAHAQWTSVDGEAVEMMLWFGALATPGVTRSALVLRNHIAHELTAAEDSADVDVQPLGEYLYEPDPAVIRARLIGQFAREHGLGMLDERIAYVTGDTLVQSPFAQAFRVDEVLPASENKLKKLLRERGIGRLEIKKRGMDVDPAALRKRLSLRGENDATLILTRAGSERVAILAERILPR